MTCSLVGGRLLSRASVLLGLSASLPAVVSSGIQQHSTNYLQATSCQTRHGSSCTMNKDRTYTVDPKGKHTSTLIFLHGLGDTGQGWSESLRGMQAESVRIVCPTASTQPVTLNGGFPMPSWFDIFGLAMDSKQDETGIKAASDDLKSLIKEEEQRGIPLDHIVIGGFSQGGAVALHAGLTSEKALGGIVAFSTWLPMHTSMAAQMTEAGRGMSILQCHGEIDPMVPLSMGKMTGAFLTGAVKNHELKTFPGMAHSSSLEELRYLDSWLKKRLESS